MRGLMAWGVRHRRGLMFAALASVYVLCLANDASAQVFVTQTNRIANIVRTISIILVPTGLTVSLLTWLFGGGRHDNVMWGGLIAAAGILSIDLVVNLLRP